SILALVVALTSVPVMLVLSWLSFGLYLGEGMLGVSITLCVLGLGLPLTGLLLGQSALRRLEAQPQSAGRGMACGALFTSLVGGGGRGGGRRASGHGERQRLRPLQPAPVRDVPDALAQRDHLRRLRGPRPGQRRGAAGADDERGAADDGGAGAGLLGVAGGGA